MSKINILGLPVYQPRGYSISEYDKSSGILKTSKIMINLKIEKNEALGNGL
mgnify:CR=1 FL=1